MGTNNTFANIFCERLKNLREHHGWSQRQVADLINIKYQTYYNYESGRREPSIDILTQLATFFNCSVDYLIGLSDVPKQLNTTYGSDEDIYEIKKEILSYISSAKLSLEKTLQLKDLVNQIISILQKKYP